MLNNIRINSADRSAESPSSTNFTVRFNSAIVAKGGPAAVMSASIPMLYYNVTADTSRMAFIENLGGVTTALLPEGFYDAITLPPLIKAAMESVSANTRTYTITIDSATGLMTVAVGVGTVSWRNITGDTRFPFDLTGLPADETTTAGTLVGTTPVKAVLHPSLYIHCSLNDASVGSQMSSGLSSIARIPMSGTSFGDVTDFRNVEQSRFAMFYAQTNVRVRLLTAAGDIVDLKGDWTFDIAFE